VDEVELDVLAGGYVGDSVGVFLAEVGEHFELGGVEASVGDLDALHAGGVP
jgi:UDP-glucose 6-dehydrogenase